MLPASFMDYQSIHVEFIQFCKAKVHLRIFSYDQKCSILHLPNHHHNHHFSFCSFKWVKKYAFTTVKWLKIGESRSDFRVSGPATISVLRSVLICFRSGRKFWEHPSMTKDFLIFIQGYFIRFQKTGEKWFLYTMEMLMKHISMFLG